MIAQNSPIIIKNYLVDQQIVQKDSIEEKDLLRLKMEMNLMVFQTLDLIESHYSKIKTEEQNKAKNVRYNEDTFLGCLSSSNLGLYEFDVYAYLSNTKYKYVLIKNELHSIQR